MEKAVTTWIISSDGQARGEEISQCPDRLTHITEMVNKVRERGDLVLVCFFFAGNSCSITPWATIQLNPALLPPCLRSSLSSRLLSWRTMLFHSTRSLSTTYSILYTFLLNLSARVFARYPPRRSLRSSSGFFLFNFLVFLPLHFH